MFYFCVLNTFDESHFSSPTGKIFLYFIPVWCIIFARAREIFFQYGKKMTAKKMTENLMRKLYLPYGNKNTARKNTRTMCGSSACWQIFLNAFIGVNSSELDAQKINLGRF